jgi:hypothetical protein
MTFVHLVFVPRPLYHLHQPDRPSNTNNKSQTKEFHSFEAVAVAIRIITIGFEQAQSRSTDEIVMPLVFRKVLFDFT